MRRGLAVSVSAWAGAGALLLAATVIELPKVQAFTATEAEPVRVAFFVSVTVIVFVPPLFSVTLKLLVPWSVAMKVKFGGSPASGSLLVKRTVPRCATEFFSPSSALTVRVKGVPALIRAGAVSAGAVTLKCVVLLLSVTARE